MSEILICDDSSAFAKYSMNDFNKERESAWLMDVENDDVVGAIQKLNLNAVRCQLKEPECSTDGLAVLLMDSLEDDVDDVMVSAIQKVNLNTVCRCSLKEPECSYEGLAMLGPLEDDVAETESQKVRFFSI